MLVAELRYVHCNNDGSKTILYIEYVQMRDLFKRENLPCHDYQLLHLVLLTAKIPS